MMYFQNWFLSQVNGYLIRESVVIVLDETLKDSLDINFLSHLIL